MYSEMSAEPLIDGHRQCDQMLEYKVVNFFNSCPNVATLVFTQKVIFFKVAQKVTTYVGYFCKKICLHELSELAQSGHTALQ